MTLKCVIQKCVNQKKVHHPWEAGGAIMNERLRKRRADHQRNASETPGAPLIPELECFVHTRVEALEAHLAAHWPE